MRDTELGRVDSNHRKRAPFCERLHRRHGETRPHGNSGRR